MLRSSGTSFRGAAMIFADVRPMMNPRMPPMMTLSATRRKRNSVRMMLMATANPIDMPSILLTCSSSCRRDVIPQERPDKDEDDTDKDKSHNEITSFLRRLCPCRQNRKTMGCERDPSIRPDRANDLF